MAAEDAGLPALTEYKPCAKETGQGGGQFKPHKPDNLESMAFKLCTLWQRWPALPFLPQILM